MKIDFPDSPGIRELLDQFGDDAVLLESQLTRIGQHHVSERLIAIAQALWLAHAKGEVKSRVEELDKNDPALGDRRG